MNIILQAPNGQPDFWSGYTIEVYDGDGDVSKQSLDSPALFAALASLDAPYIIKQPAKEKDWLLLRNKPQPSMMFPVAETMSKTLKLKGYGWFKEIIEGDTITIKPMN